MVISAPSRGLVCRIVRAAEGSDRVASGRDLAVGSPAPSRTVTAFGYQRLGIERHAIDDVAVIDPLADDVEIKGSALIDQAIHRAAQLI